MAHLFVADECAIGFHLDDATSHVGGRPFFDLPKTSFKNIIMTELVKYLRDVAHTCTSLARACPHLPTSRGLEEVAIDLMAKAQELEHLFPK